MKQIWYYFEARANTNKLVFRENNRPLSVTIQDSWSGIRLDADDDDDSEETIP